MRFFRINALLAVCAAAQSPGPDKEAAITRLETRSLATWHFAPQVFDDSLSRKIFSLYLKRLDPQKRFLLRSDVDSLLRFQDSLDGQLKRSDYGFSEIAAVALNRRIGEAAALVRELFQAGFRHAEEDSLPTDMEKQEYCRTSAELRLRWAKLIKHQVLLRLEDQREEAAQKDTAAARKAKRKRKIAQALPDSAQIRIASAYVSRSLERAFARMLREEKLDRVAAYLNAAANSLDPHTEYFKPEAREEFNLAMSGTLEGIGAVLREDDGYIKVVSIVPGSAAWRQKELKAEDKILKVAQGREEGVDIVDVSVQEAVRLIRGKKGTEVRLTVEKPSGQSKLIPIVRDVVVVEEAYAKSAVLQAPGAGRTYGYIALPSFYHDFMNPEGRNSADDVRRELEKLKARKMEGLLLDLRGNGGGALEDAVRMAGLFLPGGPVVQVHDRRGVGSTLEDTDPEVVFSGPLVILVNTFSASASEILAAAMQDYGRAVVVGSDTTFGKGTVQTLVDLDNFAAPTEAALKPLGTVKLTVQKFYRVNGGSTQFRGVVPDVLLPDGYTNLDIGEKSLEHAMPWDTVRSLDIRRMTNPPPVKELQAKSRTRIAASPYFKRVAEFLKRQESFRGRQSLPLGLTKFFAERDKTRKESEALEALQKQATGLSVEPIETEGAVAAADSIMREKFKAWKEQLGQDFYLRESVNILGDLTAAGIVKR